MHSKRGPTKVYFRRYTGVMTVTTIQQSASPAAVRSMALIAALVVALVAVLGVSVYYWNHGHALASGLTTVSHQQSAPAHAAPPVSLDGQANQFLFLLNARGITPSGNGTASVTDAHSVCARVQQGESQQQVVQSIVAGTPSMSKTTAGNFAKTAIDVYCPKG